MLFHEADPGEELFVVESGRIAIANRSFDGRESVVALMEAGDVFGEMSLFDGQGRSAEARALMKEAASWKPSLSASYSKTGRRALKSSLALRMLSRFCSVVSQGCALRSSASRWVVLVRRVSDTRTTVSAAGSRWKVDFLCRVGGLPDPWLGQVESPSGGGAHPPAGDPLDEWSGERNPLDTVPSSLHCSCL